MYSSSSRSPRGLGLSSESRSGSSAMSLNTPTNVLKLGLQLRRDSQEAGPAELGNPDKERSSSETVRVVREPRPPSPRLECGVDGSPRLFSFLILI